LPVKALSATSGGPGNTVEIAIGSQTARGSAVEPVERGAQVVAAVRPDDVRPGPAGDPGLQAVVEVVEYQGRELAVEARTPDGVRLFLRTPQRLAPGDLVSLSIEVERLLVFPAEGFGSDDERIGTEALAPDEFGLPSARITG